jgi:hypothetical protein
MTRTIPIDFKQSQGQPQQQQAQIKQWSEEETKQNLGVSSNQLMIIL